MDAGVGLILILAVVTAVKTVAATVIAAKEKRRGEDGQ